MSGRKTTPTPSGRSRSTPRTRDETETTCPIAKDAANYKTMLLKKDVLDTFRLYLEPSETLLQRLARMHIITTEERSHISALKWPVDRNELLRVLVKKPWDSGTFDLFYEVIRQTQNTRLTETLHFYITQTTKEDPSTRPTTNLQVHRTSDPQEEVSILDRQLADLSMRTQNIVRGLLRDKDHVISRLKSDLAKVRDQARAMEEENSLKRYELDRLDTLVTDLITEVCLDSVHHTTAEGIAAARREVLDLRASLSHEKNVTRQSQDIEEQLQFTNTLLNDQTFELRKAKEKAERSLVETSTELQELQEALTQKGDLSNQLQRSLTIAQANLEASQKQSAAMQSETTSRMDKMASALTEMTKSRDKAMGELCTINDRARKLLYSLGLSNALLHTSNAIDHARNLALERRRNGSVRLMQVDNKNGEMKGEISEEIPVHSQEKQNPDSSQSSEHGALPKQINTEGASIASLSGRLSPRHEEFAPYRSADNPGERGETSMKPLEIKRVY